MKIMKINRWGLMAAVLLIALGSVSCKKNNQDTTLPNIPGTLRITGGKSMVETGEILRFTPVGLETPEGKTITYSWKATGMETTEPASFEDGGWQFAFEEPKTTYTVTCYAACDGYYSSSASGYVTTVTPGWDGSIPMDIDRETAKIFTDPRDNVEYLLSTIDGLDWFANNLAWTGAGIAYHKFEVTNTVLGRYYNYEEAKTSCPEGWSLPTDAQWMSAAQTVSDAILEEHKVWEGVSGSFMEDLYFNGTKLWEFWPEVKVTNATGLYCIPVGFCNTVSEEWDGIYDNASFWTADSLDEEKAFARYIIVDQPDMLVSAVDKASFGASVRCVRPATE